MRGRRHVGAVLLVALSVTSFASSSKAQDQVEQAIYSDVKTVITDVITAEIAQNVGPNFACISGRVPAPSTAKVGDAGIVQLPDSNGTSTPYQLEATRYFPGSLQLIYNQNFG